MDVLRATVAIVFGLGKTIHRCRSRRKMYIAYKEVSKRRADCNGGVKLNACFRDQWPVSKDAAFDPSAPLDERGNAI